MNATFVQVDALELARLQRDPSQVEGLFQGDGVIPEAFVKASKVLQERMKVLGSQTLAGGLTGEDIIKLMEERRSRLNAQASEARGSHATLSLDKAWHGVHYLICGETEPGAALLSQAVLGGTALGDDDEGFSGYGPARCFTASEAAQLAQELSRPGVESEAAARFDAQRMSELQIYPGWETSDADWVLDAFRRLRDFYSEAATNGRAIVTCIV